jgi:predicted nucleic acid-binding protein
VVDAAILVAAVQGRSSGAFLLAGRVALLATPDRVVHEARRRIEIGLKRPELVQLLEALAAEITIVPMAALAAGLGDAETALRDAVPSRNGSTKDAPVLALARSIDADVWTTDRDFAGTGIATWSTPNLIRGFAAAGEAA